MKRRELCSFMVGFLKLNMYTHMKKLMETVDNAPDDPAFTYGNRKFFNYDQFTSRLKQNSQTSRYESRLVFRPFFPARCSELHLLLGCFSAIGPSSRTMEFSSIF